MRSQNARLPPRRRRDRPHLVLGSAASMLAKTLKPEPRNASLTFCISIGLRRSGLSEPYFAHRVGVGDARKLRRHRLAAGELLEHAAQHRLDRVEHVLLRDEAHLDVELVELARRAVGARVLVAEARRDLEVAVEARDHDQLLELLRRLRQRVELARDAAATAPGSRARPPGDDAVRIGVWNSKKPCSFMRRRIESMIAPRIMMLCVQLVAAQVEEAVLEPRSLPDIPDRRTPAAAARRPAPAPRSR